MTLNPKSETLKPCAAAVFSPRFPALQHLDVSGCRRVRGDDLAGLAGMRGLRSLVLSGCEDVGDEGVASLAALTQLTALNLSNCCKVSSGPCCKHGLCGLLWLNAPRG